MVKKFILNADGLGLSKAINRGVLEGYSGEMLKSASVVANGAELDDVFTNIIPNCPELKVGIHLNLTSGKSLYKDKFSLNNEDGTFTNSFLSLVLRAYNPKDKSFMSDIESEFRLQIEKILSKTKVTHIDSYEHIHAIPPIFELVCKLANEYKIHYVRTHYEKFYIVPDVFKHFCKKYYSNLFKRGILNFFSLLNESCVHKYKLKTNDYINGILYESLCDSLTVSYGISSLRYNNMVLESIIHPCRYDEGNIDNYFNEFMIAKNKKLKDKLEKSGFDITNYYEEES